MLVLVLVGLVAGVITSLSPCVLPVPPVVVTASVPSHTGAASNGATEHDDTGRRERSWRPYGVVAGLVGQRSAQRRLASRLVDGSQRAPTLYTLLEQPQNQRMTIRLTPDPGAQAYSSTFD
jgi:hypothetical protein